MSVILNSILICQWTSKQAFSIAVLPIVKWVGLLVTLTAHTTPRVNFTDVLLKVFTGADPESAKKTDSFTVSFALLGSALVKAAHR